MAAASAAGEAADEAATVQRAHTVDRDHARVRRCTTQRRPTHCCQCLMLVDAAGHADRLIAEREQGAALDRADAAAATKRLNFNDATRRAALAHQAQVNDEARQYQRAIADWNTLDQMQDLSSAQVLQRSAELEDIAKEHFDATIWWYKA